ncbi:MAG: DUF2182 domain-containing protein [Gemmatimonadales bacterium]
MRSQSSVAGSLRRDRVAITSCIVLITALAWAYLVHLNGQMTANMGMAMTASWGVPDVFFTFLMWAVMMVGMMSPTAAPVLFLFSGMQVRQPGGLQSYAVPLFALGYTTVWVGFSALAALAQWALHEAALLSPGMAASSSRVAGAILIAAGIYQLTPAKGACLRQCQSPLGFLLSRWRDGEWGALQMGLRHGLYCLGCCWALMTVLFVVGVMNLVWVAALTGFILLEKFGGAGPIIARLGGAALIAFGVLIVVR